MCITTALWQQCPEGLYQWQHQVGTVHTNGTSAPIQWLSCGSYQNFCCTKEGEGGETIIFLLSGLIVALEYIDW